MDDTTQSRISDAAATRKRRSSILKSQRPPRTPFCELEFNVCTPTDTTKSRRVSFSRRTGVAEFVTNEATTTWKNFYEEHNKSLESSGNDSAENNKQPIGHLGKRIFDQQFEEVEAVDFLGSLNPGMSVSTSINNFNFSQQLECTDSKLVAPQNNFEFSNLTEQQSKLFGDDIAISCPGEMTERVDINFSAIQRIGETDDLDEIQKDLQRQSNVLCQGPFNGRQNVSEYIEIDLNMTHVAMTNEESDMSITDTIHSPKVQDVSKSCSIEKKINVDKDWVTDKENIAINPYITPRESINFAINEEPENVLVFDGKKLFVQTEKPKQENYRQTLLPGTPEIVPQRKTIVLNCNDDLPNFIDDVQIPRKYSSFGVPELKKSVIFDGDMSITQGKVNFTQNKQTTILYDDDLADISVTQCVANKPVPVIAPEKEKRRTIVYENDTGNISVTQTLPSKIIDTEKDVKRRTVVFENGNGNVSITQPLPNVILSESKETRKTIVIDNEACNIFVTPAVPTNIILPENIESKRRTIVFENDNGNVSITQAIPNIVINDNNERRTTLNDKDMANKSSMQLQSTNKQSIHNAALPERRRTVVFENDVGNLSVTQALPTNIILTHKLNATKYDDDINISMTQALPANIILNSENMGHNRRRTVVFDDDTGNLSITQAVPTNHVMQELAKQNFIVESSDIETTHAVSLASGKVDDNRTKTIVFDPDNVDLSMTQTVNTNKLLPGLMKEDILSDPLPVAENKRRTIVFENEAADISVTQAVPMNRVMDTISAKQNEKDDIKEAEALLHNVINKRKTIVFENEDADISMTQAVDMNQLLQSTIKNIDHLGTNDLATHNSTNKRRTVVFEDEDADISMTQVVDVNKIIHGNIEKIESIEAIIPVSRNASNKNELEISKHGDSDLSIAQAVDINKITQKQIEETDYTEATKAVLHNESNRRRTVVFENEDADISVTQAVNANEVIQRNIEYINSTEATKQISHNESNKNALEISENKGTNLSISQAVVENQLIQKQIEQTDYIEATKAALHNTTAKRKSFVFKNDDASITKTEDVNKELQENNDHTEATKATSYTMTNKRKSVVFVNEDSNLSTIQAVNIDRNTLVFENENNEISMTAMVSTNEVMKSNENQEISQKETEAATNTALHFHNDLGNNRRTLMFDDDEENTLNKSDSLIKTKHEKLRTIVVEDIDTMLENKDLFMDVDKLNDEKPNENEHDVSMTEVNTEKPNIGSFMSKTHNMSITEPLSPRVPNDDKKTVFFDDTTNKTSKPIPAGFAFKTEICDKEKTLQDMSKHDDMLLNVSTVVSNVIVYQAGTVNSTKRTRISEGITNVQESLTVEDPQETTPPAINSSDTVTTAYLAKLSSFYKKSKVKQSKEHAVESGGIREKSDDFVNKHGSAEQLKLVEMNETEAEKTRSKVSPLIVKDSILDDLLDMSQSSVDGVGVDDSLKMNELKDSLNDDVRAADSYITYTVPEKDSRQNIINKDGNVSQANKSHDNINVESNADVSKSCLKSPIHIEFKEESDIDDNLPVKITQLKSVLKEDKSPHYLNKQEFNADSSESKESLDKSNTDMTAKNSETISIDKKEASPKYGKSFRMANDTNELLEMLSDFTDKRKSRNLDPHLEEDESFDENVISSPLALGNKQDTIPELLKRFSNLPNDEASESAQPNSTLTSFRPDERTSQPVHLKRHHFVSNEEISEPNEPKKSSSKEVLEPNPPKRLTFVPMEQSSESEQTKVQNFVPKEETSEPYQPKRLSLVSKRQSIVLSREDLLNNLSMAGAALQKSRFDLDDSESINDTTKETPEIDVSHKKSVRVSNDVVKTLHFEEDESASEASFKTEINTTPLKKTAFGEVTYMKDTKAKVIPDYTERIDDGIKELMNDLVKPMADVLPFPSVTLDRVKKSPSVRSNQIQANLQTSSQIDLGTELYSNPESTLDMSKYSTADVITTAKRCASRAKSPGKPNLAFTQSEKSIEVDYVSQDTGKKPVIHFTSPPKQERPDSPGTVLIFDHSNPLNNVFLPPPSITEAHCYNPAPSRYTIMETDTRATESDTSVSIQLINKESESENVNYSTHYHVESKYNRNSINNVDAENADVQSNNSIISKPMSIDQSTDPVLSQDLRNTEVNTEIAMKGNKELLAASSSLTLVDDALARSAFDVDVESHSSQEDDNRSPVQVLYKSVESPEKAKCKPTNDDSRDKPKKRVYSPAARKERHKNCTLSSLDVTPKPVSKMQKLSTSPSVQEKPKTIDDSPEKLKRSPKTKKPAAVTVQQVLTVVHQEKSDSIDVIPEMKETRSVARLDDARSEVTVIPASSGTRSEVSNVEDRVSDITSSFTSSKNLRESPVVSRVGSRQSSRLDWVPHGSLSGTSSRVVDSDSSANVFDIIDMLPFMGSHECEWEYSNEDAWSFRLLHSRLRLTVCFQRNRGVRADTPVTDVALETTHHDKKNPLGALCVKFAAATVRHYIARGCAAAGDVPRLVRHAAAAARVAARWARAMHDARARLAYTLTADGWLALKVANIPLRCVWEVTMQLEMVAADARAPPAPRAAAVRVARVLGGAPPAPDAVRRALAAVPPDWGHAPRSIWKIFRYLKNKKRDDDMMLLK